MKFDHASVYGLVEDIMPLPFVIKVPAAVTAKAPCLRSLSRCWFIPSARHDGAPRECHGDAAAAALVQPHEWCNGAGGAALLYMVVRDDWLAPSAPGTA